MEFIDDDPDFENYETEAEADETSSVAASSADGVGDNYFMYAGLDGDPNILSVVEQSCYCGVEYEVVNEISSKCPSCGIIIVNSILVSETSSSTVNGHIQYTGKGVGGMQRNLYKSAVINIGEAQREAIKKEMLGHCFKYEQINKKNMPKDFIDRAVDEFIKIKMTGVMRGTHKLKMMAIAYREAGIYNKIAVPQLEIAKAFNLRSKGLSNGMSSYRDLIAKKKIDGTVTEPTTAEINTLFIYLKLESPDDMTNPNAEIKERVKKLIDTANAARIGVTSELKSKVAGATMLILEKYYPTAAVTVEKISEAINIRKQTIEKYIKAINERKSRVAY